jgi:integrase
MNLTVSSLEPVILSRFLLHEWLPNVRRTVRATTYESYCGHVRCHLIPAMGETPIKELSPVALNAFYQRLLSTGLSVATVRRVHATLRRALRDAVRWRVLEKNPAIDADPPKDRGHEFREMQTWSAEQLRAFLAFIAKDPLYELWFVIAMTGLRRGEALGLRWQDLDLDSGHLAVRQTFVTVGHDVQRSKPKTSRGQRVVALDVATVAVLKKLRRREERETTSLVFGSEMTAPLHPTAVTKRFNRLVSASGLPRIRLHDLRHTHASLALSAGIHPKIVSERLGHSTVAFTLDVYSHSNPHLQQAAADSIRNVVFPGTG